MLDFLEKLVIDLAESHAVTQQDFAVWLADIVEGIVISGYGCYSGRATWMSKSRSSKLTVRVVTQRIESLTRVLNQLRHIFPPLKKLLFEAFWFVFAAAEIVRFLRSLL